MKIPEALFAIVNPVTIALLHSPVHGLMSDSLMTITYTGARSGATRRVPVRYLRDGNQVICTTSRDTGWWPNFIAPRPVQLRLAGKDIDGEASATIDNPNRIGPVLLEMWSRYPADAAYMGVKLDQGGRPDPEQFEQASADAVLVTIDLG